MVSTLYAVLETLYAVLLSLYAVVLSSLYSVSQYFWSALWNLDESDIYVVSDIEYLNVMS